jgi:hypothetical protein
MSTVFALCRTLRQRLPVGGDRGSDRKGRRDGRGGGTRGLGGRLLLSPGRPRPVITVLLPAAPDDPVDTHDTPHTKEVDPRLR